MAIVRTINPIVQRQGMLRVAAYCRVSSDSEDQLNSYAAQIDHYTNLVKNTDGWELVDIYADEGITGTSMDKREEYHSMMRAARRGMIDKILVKSVSRLARNTMECLLALRELKALGVTVLFEKENLNTGTLSSELFTSLFASMAQEESVSISQNQRWSYQKRMRSGEFITCKAPFGYELLEGKRLAVNESEWEFVRWIYTRYLSGMPMLDIADAMTNMGIPTREGSARWSIKTVRYILRNEKYMGDSLLQKTYATEGFPSRKVRNRGQRGQYYVENSHPPIIDRETWEKVQALMDRRCPPQIETGRYPLTLKISCGQCGESFKRRVTKKGRVYWVCRSHDRDKDACPIGRIAEEDIYVAFTHIYNTLKANLRIILWPVLDQLEALEQAVRRSNPRLRNIDREVMDLAGRNLTLQRLRGEGLIDAGTYFEKANALNTDILELRRKRRILLMAQEDEGLLEDIQRLVETIEDGPKRMKALDEELFADIVDSISAEPDGLLRFCLTGGLGLDERI